MEEDRLIRTKILKIENHLALLVLDDGQVIKVKRRFLPWEIKEGEEVVAEFLRPAEFEKRKKNLAKAILEEILRGNEGK